MSPAAQEHAKKQEGTMASAMASGDAIPKLRWRIGALLAFGILVNYIDRINLSVAAPQIQAEFGLTSIQLGWLFSAFFWLYALLQIPSGILLDKLGVSLTMRVSTLLWGVSSGLVILASGFTGILGSRIILGVAEAPAYPASSKATGYWFPRSERGLSTAMFDAASRFSNVIGVPFVAFFAVSFGWRWAFAATAVLSFVYFLMFVAYYRDPSRHPKLDPREHRYMLRGGAAPEGRSNAKPGASMLTYLLGRRKVWAVALGFAAYGYVFFLFLTWLPNYLVQELQISMIKSAGYAAIPWLCGTIAELVVGGWLVDWLIRRGGNEVRVRKTVLVSGLLIGMSVVGAVFTRDPVWAIFWISLSLSGLSVAAPVCWTLPALIAPTGAGGTLTGITNFFNNMSGVAAPVITGYIVSGTGSFALAFVGAGIALLIGILSFTVLLGSLDPIPDPDSPEVETGAALPAAGYAQR
jgi:MFS transporter, ACS family, D-galactonate transporter